VAGGGEKKEGLIEKGGKYPTRRKTPEIGGFSAERGKKKGGKGRALKGESQSAAHYRPTGETGDTDCLEKRKKKKGGANPLNKKQQN